MLYPIYMDRQDLHHLKKLCRIDCTQEEEEILLSSLQQTLHYIQQLKEVDTEHAPPCSYVLRRILKNPLREDQVENSLSRESFLANAPDQIGGMIRTPPILKPIE